MTYRRCFLSRGGGGANFRGKKEKGGIGEGKRGREGRK